MSVTQSWSVSPDKSKDCPGASVLPGECGAEGRQQCGCSAQRLARGAPSTAVLSLRLSSGGQGQDPRVRPRGACPGQGRHLWGAQSQDPACGVHPEAQESGESTAHRLQGKPPQPSGAHRITGPDHAAHRQLCPVLGTSTSQVVAQSLRPLPGQGCCHPLHTVRTPGVPEPRGFWRSQVGPQLAWLQLQPFSKWAQLADSHREHAIISPASSKCSRNSC